MLLMLAVLGRLGLRGQPGLAQRPCMLRPGGVAGVLRLQRPHTAPLRGGGVAAVGRVSGVLRSCMRRRGGLAEGPEHMGHSAAACTCSALQENGSPVARWLS